MTDKGQTTIKTLADRPDRRVAAVTKRVWRSLTAAIVLLAALLTAGAAPASASGTVFVNEGESIQAAIDAADPGTRIIVKGDHVENLWITTDGITLQGNNATLTAPAEPTPVPPPCQNFEDPSAVALICVLPSTWSSFEEAPATRINGVNITGFTLNNSGFDGISIAFADGVRVTDNTIPAPGCDGIFVIFGTKVQVNRNTVTDAGCSGIGVVASSNARIQQNVTNGSFGNGIAVNDTSRVVVHRNTATGNCIGIGVVDGADGGFGFLPEEVDGSIARVSNNVTNANNRTCPFGPEAVVGGTGIIVGGVTNLAVTNNTANGNTIDGNSLTAGGIFIGDFPNQDGSTSVGDNVRVANNSAEGNSSAAGPVDLVLATAGNNVRVTNNSCSFGAPDPSLCN